MDCRETRPAPKVSKTSAFVHFQYPGVIAPLICRPLIDVLGQVLQASMSSNMADNGGNLLVRCGADQGNSRVQGIRFFFELLHVPLQGCLSPPVAVRVVDALHLVDGGTCRASGGCAIALNKTRTETYKSLKERPKT